MTRLRMLIQTMNVVLTWMLIISITACGSGGTATTDAAVIDQWAQALVRGDDTTVTALMTSVPIDWDRVYRYTLTDYTILTTETTTVVRLTTTEESEATRWLCTTVRVTGGKITANRFTFCADDLKPQAGE